MVTKGLPTRLQWLKTTPILAIGVRLVVLLGVFLALTRLLVRRLHLPGEAYFEPIILIETAKHVVGSWLLLAGVFGLLVVLSIRFKDLTGGWEDSKEGQVLRWFVTLMAFLLAWDFSTNDYNLFVDQAHLVDRIAILFFVVLVFWRPIFVVPFLVLLIPFIWQYDQPIDANSWAWQNAPLQILLIYSAVHLVGSFWRRSWTVDFVFLSICVMGANYWFPGYGKLVLNWIAHDNVHFLLTSTYANGWLAMLHPDTVGAIASYLEYGNPLFKFVTMFVEVGVLVLFWRKGLMVALLGMAALNHIGIWFMSGICFWEWVVVDLALIAVVRALYEDSSGGKLFSTSRLILGAVIIASGAALFSPPSLSWYDSRASIVFRLEGTTEGGKVLDLHPQFFDPYDDLFSMSGFHYLDPEPSLGIYFGATRSLEIAEALAGSDSVADVIELQSRLGTIRYDRERAETFYHFVEQFVTNYNHRRSKSTFLSYVQSPPHISTFPFGVEPGREDCIVRVDVFSKTSMFDGKSVVPVERRLLNTIDVDPASCRD